MQENVFREEFQKLKKESSEELQEAYKKLADMIQADEKLQEGARQFEEKKIKWCFDK